MNTKIRERYEKRVKAGASLLDKRVPGWHRNVLLTRLNMKEGFYHSEGTGCGCVLSQIDAYRFNEGPTGVFDWVIEMWWPFRPVVTAVRYGFEVANSELDRTDDLSDSAYRLLDHLWSEEIRARRKAAA
jgi:hypothetical protein